MRSRSEAGSDLPETTRGGTKTALAIGLGRVALGSAFVVRPRESMTFLGVDTATASRVSWLAQMTAARDIAIGAGTAVTAITGRGSAGWLIAGAACDLADATAIGAALTRKQVSPVTAAAMCAGAVVVAAGAVAAVLAGRRQTLHLAD